MKSKISTCKLLREGLLFVVLIAATFYILLHNQNLEEIKMAVKQVNIIYIVIGLFCMGIYSVGEAMNIRRGLQLFGEKVSAFHAVKYALAGFFFSAITPSATGGQPMQLYYMHKDKVDLSHGSLALLIELASYQTITIGYALVGFVIQAKTLYYQVGNIRYLLVIGILLNVCLLVLTLVSIFSKKIIAVFIQGSVWILKKLRFKRAEQFEMWATRSVAEYQKCAVYFRKNRKTMLAMLVTTFVQITAMHSVPFWIYRAFGLSQYAFWQIIGMQAVLFIGVSVIPLPGTVGINESGFLRLFKTLFPTAMLSSAMLLSRGVSFYLCVVISGSILGILYFVEHSIRIKQS